MKRILLAVLIGFSALPSYGVHLLGGEIYWDCIGSGADQGKFIFHVKLYRACYAGAASLSSSVAITNPLFANFGGPSTILCSKVSAIDVSPACAGSGSNIQCGLSFSNPLAAYAVDENYYKSLPVQLNGIPDSAGSAFYFSTCCRPNTLNLTNNQNFYLQAVMYPYIPPGSTTPLSIGSGSTPSCYDSSPRYAATLDYVGTGSQLNGLASPATDPDGDYLWCNLGSPLIAAGVHSNYQSGYSPSELLPDTNFNSLNVPITVNPTNGTINFATHGMPGLYTFAQTISGYRHGQKIAEIPRDFPIVVLPLPTDPYSLNNQAPSVHFKNASDTVFTVNYADTFDVGQLIRINVLASDTDSLSSIDRQSVSIKLLPQSAVGTPFNNLPCNLASCATLDTINPDWDGSLLIDTGQTTAEFTWQPMCDVFSQSGYPPLVNGRFKTFLFSVEVSDNSCPNVATVIAAFNVTIRDTTGELPDFHFLEFADDSLVIAWNPVSPASFSGYELYSSSSQLGPFTLLKSLTNVNDTMFSDTIPQISTGPRYYQLVSPTSTGCGFGENTTSSIVLDANFIGSTVSLQWNGMYKALNPFVNGYHYIEADTGTGFVVLDSAVNTGLNMTWTDVITTCLEKAVFRIRAFDLVNQTTYLSNEDSVQYFNPYLKVDVTICTNDSVLLGGTYRHEAGTYFDTTYTSVGCSEVVEYSLATDSAYFSVEPDIHFCNGDSILLGGSYYSEAGVKQVIYQTIDGCDSTFSYNLIKTTVATNVLQFGSQLVGPPSADSYQWIDCASGAVLAGDTSQVFYATVAGKYAVILTENGCIDTSFCFDVVGIGVDEVTRLNELKVFPNPVQDILFITPVPESEELRISLYSMHGSLMKEVSGSQIKEGIPVSDLPTGLYHVRILNTVSGDFAVRKVVIGS